MRKLGLPFIFMVLLLVACAMAGTPGHIYESTSKFDNSKTISMEPAWLYDSAPGIKLKLFKSTKMPKDSVLMVAIVAGIHNFAEGESLHFNIDGDVVSFASIDDMTDFETKPGFSGSGMYIPPSNWSSKNYLVTMDFLDRIINAKKVIVRVNLTKTYFEGEFSTDAFTTARPAFREFCERVRAWNLGPSDMVVDTAEKPTTLVTEKPEAKKEPELSIRIKARCGEKWPGNYRMQKYCVDDQNKAFMEFYPLFKKYPKGSEESNIILRCANKWYDQKFKVIDYRMALYCVNEELKAYRELYK